MNKLNFLLGEKRKIWLEITSTEGSAFLIRNAKYELKKHGKTEIEGDCQVVDHTIITTVQPQETGQYSLIYTYEIGGETLKEEVIIIVG